MPDYSFLSGTLIIAVPHHDGVVVCSDRRITGAKEDEPSEATKVLQIGKNGLIGMTGSAAVTLGSGETLFSLDMVVRRCLQGLDARTLDRRLNAICQCLQQNIVNLVSAFPHGYAPPGKEDDKFCELPVFFRDLSSQIQMYVIKARHSWETGQGAVSYHAGVEGRLAQATPIAYGNEGPPIELRIGTDPEFESFRKEQLIARVYQQPPPDAADLDEDTAMQAAKRVVQAAGEMNRIKGAPDTIGRSTDCFVLSRSDGARLAWRAEE